MEDNKLMGKMSLRNTLDSFITSYAERDSSTIFAKWLEDRLKQEIPDMSQEACEKLAGEIIGAVADYDKTLKEVNAAIADGQSKESWFAGRLAEVYADMPLEVAGERLQQLEDSLTVSNMQLIQGIEEGQAEEAEVGDVGGNPIEWNEYSIKNKAYEIGNQVILTGIAAAANVLKEKVQGDGAADVNSIVAETFQDGLKGDPGEVKAVVAGAVRAAIEKGLTDIVPLDASTAAVAGMAGAAVESAEALSDAANGKSTMTDALDKIGRASVAAGCGFASDVLKGRLAMVPFVGPLLVDLAGGLLEHMKSSKFAGNVYKTVHDAAVATWKGVKKSRVGKAVKKLGKFIFG